MTIHVDEKTGNPRQDIINEIFNELDFEDLHQYTTLRGEVEELLDKGVTGPLIGAVENFAGCYSEDFESVLGVASHYTSIPYIVIVLGDEEFAIRNIVKCRQIIIKGMEMMSKINVEEG